MVFACVWADSQNSVSVPWLQVISAAGSRTWWISGLVGNDFASGTQLTFTLDAQNSGITPPAASNLTCEVYAGGSGGGGASVLATITLNPTAPTQTVNVWLSSTPGAAGGSDRCGVFRLNLWAQQTGAGAWSADSDGARRNLGTSLTNVVFNSAVARANTTISTALSNASGGAKPAKFGYNDPVWVRTSLGAPAILTTDTVAVTLGPVNATYAIGSATTNDHQFGVCDNRFAASSNVLTAVIAASNVANLTVNAGPVPWMSPTTTTQDSDTFDPRLTFTHLHQDDDNTYGTPPMSKDVGAQRLSSNLAFLATRVTNANGAGINALTWHTTLQDAGALTTPIVSSPDPTSATEGGEAGWANTFLAWASALPTGNWTKTCTITAPAGAVGLEVGNTTTLRLVASNPNYRIICAGGPATTALDARHFTPGDPFLVGIAVINTNTFQLMALDTSPAPAVAIGRFNLTYGRAEFLAADGTTWVAATGASVYFHTCTVSPGDPNAWTLTFNGTQTSGWGNADVFIIGSAFIGGVPVNDFYKEIVVNGINNHDKYAPSISWLGLPDGK